MLALRDANPRSQPLAVAEFATLRLRLIKIAGRLTETASRVRIAFASACPEDALFTGLARSLLRWTMNGGTDAPPTPRPANIQRLLSQIDIAMK